MSESQSERLNRLLTGLKIDIGISSATIYDERLKAYLVNAMAEIEREGANISEETVESNQIIIAFAAWRWRTRDTQAGMPRALRYSLNNLVFSQRAKV